MKLFDLPDDSLSLITKHEFQGMDFVWYNEPCLHFDLEDLYGRIQSFDQLEYYAEIFLHLNPDISNNLFTGMFVFLSHRENGKTIRTYGSARVTDMTNKVYNERVTPWCRRKRRVVFNPEKIISKEEKLSITAQLLSKGVSFTKEDVLRALDSLSRAKIIATQETLSDHIGCSQRTISRLIDSEIKSIMSNNNITTRRENKISKAIEWIDVLSSEGEGLKMRYLKDLTKIRDYSILKEALSRYENHL